jgi:hypothetical protein
MKVCSLKVPKVMPDDILAKYKVLVGVAVLCLLVVIVEFGLVDWSSFVSTVSGVAAGAAVSWYFARRSSQELRKEVNRLRRVANFTALRLKNAGLVDAEFDKCGDVKSVGVESRYKVTLKSDGRIEVDSPSKSWSQRSISTAA